LELTVRILDNDRERFHMTAAAAVVAFVAYVVVFVGIVNANTTQECTLVWVDFPGGYSRDVFRPLISLHKLIDPNVLYTGEPDETRFDRCGE
jgi:hypothetical protein